MIIRTTAAARYSFKRLYSIPASYSNSRTINCLYNQRTKYFFTPQSTAQTRTFAFTRNENYDYSDNKHSLPPKSKGPVPKYAYVLLIGPALTFILGCWQMKRRTWKNDLIRKINSGAKADPQTLPKTEELSPELDYHPIVVEGSFDYSREIVIAPRSRNDKYGYGMRNPRELKPDDKFGAQIVTVFKLIDGRKILINRGWVPKSETDAANRQKGNLADSDKLTALYLSSEPKPFYVRENATDGSRWYYRNVEQMASLLGTLPIYLEADYDSSVAHGPIGGQTMIKPWNMHYQYIFFWYCLTFWGTGWWFLHFVIRRAR